MKTLLVSALFVFVSFCAAAQVNKPTNSDAEQKILQVEHAWLVAASTPDATAMDKLIADDFIGITPGGQLVHKGDIMPGDDAANKLPKLRAENPTIQIHGDTAVLMARLVADAGNAAMNSTSVFRQADGKWKLTALHLSPAK